MAAPKSNTRSRAQASLVLVACLPCARVQSQTYSDSSRASCKQYGRGLVLCEAFFVSSLAKNGRHFLLSFGAFLIALRP